MIEIQAINTEKVEGCYFDEKRYGWVRFGNFFPFEVHGNGPFFHDSVSSKTEQTGAKM